MILCTEYRWTQYYILVDNFLLQSGYSGSQVKGVGPDMSGVKKYIGHYGILDHPTHIWSINKNCEVKHFNFRPHD